MTTTKVYLAAPYGSRGQVARLADVLEQTAPGRLQVVSGWLRETHTMSSGVQGAAVDLDDDTVAGHVAMDIRQVLECDVFVLFTAASVGVDGGGGRHVETGIAFTSPRLPQLVLVGEPEHIFHRTERWLRVPDAGALSGVLWGLAQTRPGPAGDLRPPG